MEKGEKEFNGKMEGFYPQTEKERRKKNNGKKEREGKGNEKEKNNLVKNFTHAFLHFCML